MSRDQIIRDTAYAIWEAEGKPEGRATEHWKEAEARVDQSLKMSKGTLSESATAAPASRKPKPNAPAKAGASALPKNGTGAVAKEPKGSSRTATDRSSKAKV
ncbi:MAG TPA: DUF2934 domain-containing protein [Ensifer sp.]|jgi:hypothetical protein|uniref:DUF2934 domain-containing protein n=1 Tax=Ensifer sp. TaxID=1872086 RepID=UPI002E0DBE39|nr:DUF2934 domain-containing protein [Ensifer sp.]